MTNFERIKQMTIEELGGFLDAIQIDAILADGNVCALGFPKDDPGSNFISWLESEVDENA